MRTVLALGQSWILAQAGGLWGRGSLSFWCQISKLGHPGFLSNSLCIWHLSIYLNMFAVPNVKPMSSGGIKYCQVCYQHHGIRRALVFLHLGPWIPLVHSSSASLCFLCIQLKSLLQWCPFNQHLLSTYIVLGLNEALRVFSSVSLFRRMRSHLSGLSSLDEFLKLNCF